MFYVKRRYCIFHAPVLCWRNWQEWLWHFKLTSWLRMFTRICNMNRSQCNLCDKIRVWMKGTKEGRSQRGGKVVVVTGIKTNRNWYGCFVSLDLSYHPLSFKHIHFKKSGVSVNLILVLSNLKTSVLLTWPFQELGIIFHCLLRFKSIGFKMSDIKLTILLWRCLISAQMNVLFVIIFWKFFLLDFLVLLSMEP